MMKRISENTEQITQIVNELLEMADTESMTVIGLPRVTSHPRRRSVSHFRTKCPTPV